MNILVVGGAGYIGSHCVRQLQRAGHCSVIVDSLVTGHKASVPRQVPFFKADLGDMEFMVELLRGQQIELVMHFAAFAYVDESVKKPLKYYLNNVAATLRLLEAMRLANVKRFVFSSSCATFGETASLPINENTPQRPINPYGQTKLDVENALRALGRSSDFSCAILRYFNAAGAAEDGSIGEDHDPETHLIPLAVGAATGQRPPLKVFGMDYPTPDGTCLRDYVHVDDLCRAHIAVFDRLQEPGVCVDYNLGLGRPTSVKQVVEAVGKIVGQTVPWETAPRRPGDPAALYADPRKAQRELGWVPKFQTVEAIIATAWEWHRHHPQGFSDMEEPGSNVLLAK